MSYKYKLLITLTIICISLAACSKENSTVNSTVTQEEDIVENNIDLDDTTMKMLQLQQDLQRSNYKLEYTYEPENKPSMHAIITIDDEITHIEAENINMFIDNKNNVTYIKNDEQWLKNAGVYVNELSCIGNEAIQNVQAIGNIEITDLEIKASSDIGTATIKIDSEKVLPLEISIKQTGEYKNYKYTYDLDSELEIPIEVIEQAVETEQ